MSEATGSSTPSTLTFVFDTLFRFSSDTKDEIIKSFPAPESDNVQFEFSEEYFILQCPLYDDAIADRFTRHLRDFIEKEQQRDLDLFEDTRLFPVDGTIHSQRSEGYQQRVTQIVGVGVSEEGVDNILNVSAKVSPKDLDEHTLLIDHECCVKQWKPIRTNGLMDAKSRDQALARIGALCSCRLEISDSGVVLKGDRQEDLEKAISKLQRLDDMSHAQQQFPHCFSFPILEGKLSVMLQLVTLKDLAHLNDARLKTALISETTPISKDVGSALVLAMIQGGRTVLVKQSAPPRNLTGSSLWKDHPHKAIGIQRVIESPMEKPKFPTAIPRNAASRQTAVPMVKRWLNDVDSSGCEDAFRPVRDNVLEQSADTNTELSTPPLVPARPLIRRGRVPLGASHLNNTQQIVMPTNSTLTQAKELPRHFDGAANIEVPLRPLVPLPASPAHSIASPGNVTASSRTSITSDSSHPAGWNSSTISTIRLGRLIDVDGETEEPSLPGRDVHYTMRQQKSKKRVSGSNSLMIKNFEDAAKKLLDLGLPRQGPIKFEVRIGKLLFHAESCNPELRSPFPPSQWPCGFPDSKTVGLAKAGVFTSRLTTSTQDVESILDVKLLQGRQLFERTPEERDVKYCITCATKTNEYIVIEVHDDSSFELKASDVLIGAIDWHYPIRTWDARLQVATQEWSSNDYYRQAQGIVNNMGVQQSADEQTITFSTSTIDDTLSVHSVTLHRETIHATSVYPDLRLHLRETQDLAIKKLPDTENQYCGSIHVPAVMINAGRFWWEVSITSVRAAQILKENASLELDEVATWRSNSIVSQNVIKDLYALTDQLVTNMDHVGFHNNSAKSGSSSRTIAKKGTSHRTSEIDGPPGMAKFW